MKKKKIQKNKGFTMIEMIIAVFIFTVSLAALMSIAARGLKAANQAQKQVVADYLALEGIEVVRNIRDSAFLGRNNSNNWQNLFNQHGCLDQAVGSSCMFIFNGNSIELRPCVNGECTVYVSEDDADYGYRHNEPTINYVDSGYTRNIVLLPNTDNPDEINVTVTVAWNDGADQVSYSENLFLWLSVL